MMVKESEGGLGTLATRRELYSATAAKGFEHILNIWKLKKELRLMENKVPPNGSEDFVITSLPESWNKYTSSRIARPHAFLLDLVLVREVEN